MRKYTVPLLIVLLATAFTSCQRDQVNTSGINVGYDFFPLKVGKYITYNVDSTYWNDFTSGQPYQIQCQQRYEVTDSFRDDQGRLSYRINVYLRYHDTDPWLMDNVVNVTRTNTGLEYTQKNMKFLKLIFPVQNAAAWDGNVFLPLNDPDPIFDEYNNEAWQYEYSDFGKDFDPGNNPYENTVTVNEIDDQVNDPDVDSTAYAERNYAQEKYAYGIGLIYRERIYWTFQPNLGPEGGGSGHKKGYAVEMRAIENN